MINPSCLQHSLTPQEPISPRSTGWTWSHAPRLQMDAHPRLGWPVPGRARCSASPFFGPLT
eukprot:624848-Pelagomonas_calceolata.AAC.2